MAQAQMQKVLRIGVIVDGKISQERLIKAGDPVTIGDAAKNTFVIPNLKLPRQDFPIFVAQGGRYFLQFTEPMKGKVGAGNNVAGLDKVRADGSAEQQGDTWRLQLSEQDRGKITLDNVTVLFQFVTPPPVAAAVAAPRVGFRPRLVEEDDALLFGFLLLFGSIAGLFILWARLFTEPPDEDEPIQLDEKWEKLLVQVTAPPPAPAAPTDNGAGEAPEEGPKEEAPKEAAPEKADPGPPGPKASAGGPKTEAQKGAALAQKSAVIAFLTTRGQGQGGAKDVLGSDSGGAAAVAGNLAGVSSTVAANGSNGGLRGAGGPGGTGGPGGDVTIGGPGRIGGGGGGGTEVAEVKRKPVSVNTGEAADVSVEQGDMDTIRKKIRTYSAQLKYCYEDRLKEKPDLSGRVDVTFQVSGGRVSDAEIFANSTKDEKFADCILGKAKRWTMPAEFQGEFTYPFIFKPGE